MAAYCIGQIRVKEAEAWEQYRRRVGATIVEYGGEVLCRGERQTVFSGAAGEHDRVVVLRFDNLGAAKRWHDSLEYQQLIPVRDRGADVTLVLYQD